MRQQQQQEEQTPFHLPVPGEAPPAHTQKHEEPVSQGLQTRTLFGRRRRLRRALKGLDPNWDISAEQVVQILEEETRKRKRRRTWILVGVLSYFAFMALMVLGTWVLHHKFDSQVFNFIGSMTGVFGGAAAFSRTHRAAARKAAELKDMRAVGHLAAALEMQDKGTRQIVEEALIDLLPQMRASDAGLLDAEQRECLYRALRSKNHKLVMAIFKALEQIGDSRALPYVEKLEQALVEQHAWAERHTRHLQAAEIETRLQAARECLQFLQDHAQQEQARQTLLRASSAAHVAPDSLLRPAAGKSDQDPDSLLRASRSEGVEH